MCFVDLEPCEVWDEKHAKARKDHVCSSCSRTIKAGEVYLTHFSVFEGQRQFQKCCTECERDRQTFADAHDGTLCTPEALDHMLSECIGDDPESREKWQPMLDRIRGK